MYLLLYKGTTEEQIYLTNVKREKDAFEYLIKEKVVRPKPFLSQNLYRKSSCYNSHIFLESLLKTKLAYTEPIFTCTLDRDVFQHIPKVTLFRYSKDVFLSLLTIYFII